MPRQPMFGALVAATTIALVQCIRTGAPEPPRAGVTAMPAPGAPGAGPDDTRLRSGPPGPWPGDLELIAPPAHGPGSAPPPPEPTRQDKLGPAPHAEHRAPAGAAAQPGHR